MIDHSCDDGVLIFPRYDTRRFLNTFIVLFGSRPKKSCNRLYSVYSRS